MLYKVKRIETKRTHDFILTKHYAQRLPSISYSFGLFVNGKLVGICTIGKPVSHYLCTGVCGDDYSHLVYELNRLIVNEGLPKNTLSYFVSSVLRELKEDRLIIVSYADDGVGHKGYIYQATNFIYTGKTKQRTDKYMPNNKHSRHYTDEYNHLRKVRTSKHRYVYFTDKTLRKHLKYDVSEYPKGKNSNYVLGERAKTKIINRNTGTEFYE